MYVYFISLTFNVCPSLFLGISAERIGLSEVCAPPLDAMSTTSGTDNHINFEQFDVFLYRCFFINSISKEGL